VRAKTFVAFFPIPGCPGRAQRQALTIVRRIVKPLCRRSVAALRVIVLTRSTFFFEALEFGGLLFLVLLFLLSITRSNCSLGVLFVVLNER
jgi:hypothetical protein